LFQLYRVRQKEPTRWMGWIWQATARRREVASRIGDLMQTDKESSEVWPKRR
jgi:hypothetical protein